MKLKELFKGSLTQKITQAFGGTKNKEDILEELEEILVLSDISMDLVERILSNMRKKTKLRFEKDDFINLLKQEIQDIFSNASNSSSALPEGKNIIVLVGINGSGKTTSAAKLGEFYHKQGRKVLFAAADTFRAAGSSQLALWGERLNLPVVTGERGADPGSVVYNSLVSFNTKDFDCLVIDTAGRVQTKDNLMKELQKINKIISKIFPGGATDTLLVIDANMGQNTLDQARKFKEFSGITGIFLSKIDGTAKGGTVVNIVDEMKIPVKFLGTGERSSDILEFSAQEFADSLFD